MENFTEFVKNLKPESISEFNIKPWDEQSTEMVIFVEGSGNMFGGSSILVFVTLHGKNSIHETGSFTLTGIIKSGYNISRGANGDSRCSADYFKGCTTLKETYDAKPTYHAEVTNTCGGAEEAICSALSSKKFWLQA